LESGEYTLGVPQSVIFLAEKNKANKILENVQFFIPLTPGRGNQSVSL